MTFRHALPMMLIAGSLCGCNTDAAVETQIIRATAPEARKTAAPAGSTADQLIQPLPEGKWPGNIFELQRKTYELFNESFEFGHSRMAPSHGLPGPDDRYLLHGATLLFPEAEPTRGRWRISNVQLIGVVKNPDGQVYEGGRVTYKHSPKTRELNDFETKALEKVRKGTQVEWSIMGDKLRMVGAIRAVSLDCMRCHQCEKYKLLGAFTYELKREQW